MSVSHVNGIWLTYVASVLQKPGCTLPGPQTKVSVKKTLGVKSEGHLCTAYDVGWTDNDDGEVIILEEDWNLMSGDPCPIAPPQVCSTIFPSGSWSCQCPCGCGAVVKRYHHHMLLE